MVAGCRRAASGDVGGGALSIVAPSAEAIRFAAQAIRDGLLVGMPTETVYGIAADAMNAAAVEATFALKGRPADNPLIIHLPSEESAGRVVSEFPESAQKLAASFWPGPLTLVLPKRPEVPSIVTAGLSTVAIRVPAHPVALDLLSAAGTPISAPSANRFMGLSPTRAEDISPEIAVGLAVILDGGPCEVGIESVVVDLSEGRPRILRPGAINAAQIEAVLGEPISMGTERRGPGMYPRHYAPRTPVRLVERLREQDAELTFEPSNNSAQIQMSRDPGSYAARLYAALSELDRLCLEEIRVERPPQTAEWAGVNDRLQKAVSA